MDIYKIKYVFVISIFLLTGCSYPKSIGALKSNYKLHETLVVDENYLPVFRRIARKAAACWDGYGQSFLHADLNKGEASHIVQTLHFKHVDITYINETKTQVDIYIAKKVAKSLSDVIKLWARGPYEECFIPTEPIES